ncbi:MAG: DegT/DnrJ/EryC1/StrS family aminotransferase, partial [Armatimonadota bacterium]
GETPAFPTRRAARGPVRPVPDELVEAAITDNTKAIMAVDLYGVAADMDAIMDIADRHDLFLLEDVAQAQGTEWRGRKLGTIGDAGSLSFHTAKCITSGDGGAVVTDSKELRDLMQSYRQFGQPFAGAEHDFGVTGGNYRISEFVAACLRAQMERIDDLMAKRNESAAILDEMLGDIPVLCPLEFPEQVTARSYLNYVIFYDQEAAGGVHRDVFRKAVAAEGGTINLGYTYMLTDRAPLGGPVRERDKDRFFGRRIDYESLQFPVARNLIDNTMMNIHQRWLLSDEETVRDLGRAIQKVAEHIEDLKDETLEE